MNYSIYCPQFDPVSGGIRVMYGLWGHLMAKGQIALPNIQNPDVAIYPEIVRGNPFNAKRIIRYILQTPGVMSHHGVPGPTSFDPSDELYVFSRVYDQWGVDDDHILFLPIIDLHTFKDQGKKRTKTAFYCARGKNLGKHPKDAIEITRQFATDQQALADLLNECQRIYIYDKITAMFEVARLCGCPVEYWGEDSLEKLQKYEPGVNGLFYKSTESFWDAGDFRRHYQDMRQVFSDRLDRFIDKTQA